MKRCIWLVAGLVFAGGTDPLRAQFYTPYHGPGYSGGIGFQYNSKHLKIGGFYVKGYFPGGYLAGPYVPVYPGPYYGYPVGVVQKNVTVNIITPPTIIIAPPQNDDLSGVDLDLVRPSKSFPPPLKVNQEWEPEPKPKFPPEVKMPGKDVSVPKKAVRPDEKIDPVKPKAGEIPGKFAAFPEPEPPLEDARAESERLIGLGLDEFKAKSFGLAAHHFKTAAKVDPNHMLAYLLQAQADFAFARFGLAVKAIHQAIKLDKEYPNLKFVPRLSLYQGMEPEFDDHLAVLREAVKQNPKSPELLFLLAHQLWFDGQRDEALKLFALARPIAADPAAIDLFLNAGKPKLLAAK